MTKLTMHAVEQIEFFNQSGLNISPEQIVATVEPYIQEDLDYQQVVCAKIDHKIDLYRPGYHLNNGWIEGDILVAVIRRHEITGCLKIVTVLLRKSWTNSDNYDEVYPEEVTILCHH